MHIFVRHNNNILRLRCARKCIYVVLLFKWVRIFARTNTRTHSHVTPHIATRVTHSKLLMRGASALVCVRVVECTAVKMAKFQRLGRCASGYVCATHMRIYIDAMPVFRWARNFLCGESLRCGYVTNCFFFFFLLIYVGQSGLIVPALCCCV